MSDHILDLDRVAYLTPPEAAKLLRVDPSTVIGWIRSGELRAVNLARRDAKRPRWRISRAAIEHFLAGRAAVPRRLPAKRRRRDERVIQFF